MMARCCGNQTNVFHSSDSLEHCCVQTCMLDRSPASCEQIFDDFPTWSDFMVSTTTFGIALCSLEFTVDLAVSSFLSLYMSQLYFSSSIEMPFTFYLAFLVVLTNVEVIAVVINISAFDLHDSVGTFIKNHVPISMCNSRQSGQT